GNPLDVNYRPHRWGHREVDHAGQRPGRVHHHHYPWYRRRISRRVPRARNGLVRRRRRGWLHRVRHRRDHSADHLSDDRRPQQDL
ncbi:MAG: hypothetical protein AVDCRST_MAG42-41, partial [uncultured Chthoniobacterales bacterium]